ncbi:hypothetical protein TW95_gp0754 [Pandoravirus inopinatum]|uniref:Uncharacterized protein n=1 Tax=Pandoravirus inopinatum TaxID=1605721 RepID=A0A0B5IXJ4_9VIRU|nr:hypothetical protein TW95_gp0754 [Pandoravirus inopinatum]AJF97488.1 hypothetical protein [Pandoravirus inopinatum]
MHHHSLVRASGVALMVRHGLPTDAIGAWTARDLDPIDVATIIMASAVPERVHEATAMAKSASVSKKWLKYLCSIHPPVPGYGDPARACTRGWLQGHVLAAAAAGSWPNTAALIDMLRTRGSCCIEIAILHLARHGRVGAVRALLAAPLEQCDSATIINNILDPMWSLVGCHGLFSLGRFLFDVEQGRDPVLSYNERDRDVLAKARQRRIYDGPSWMAEAAKRNRLDCIEFCVECEHPIYPIELAAVALFSGSIEFYERIAACNDIATRITGRSLMADALQFGIVYNIEMEASALLWVVAHPEFDPWYDTEDRQVLDHLFVVRDRETKSVEIIEAASIVARRWPDVWARYDTLCPTNQSYFCPPAIDTWQDAIDRIDIACVLNALTPDMRSDVEGFLQRHDQARRRCQRGAPKDNDLVVSSASCTSKTI